MDKDRIRICYGLPEAMAEAVPKDKSTEGYAVTSASEIQAMRGYLSRAAGIKHLDQQMKQTIRDTKAYLRRMEANTFHILLGARSAAFELMAPGLGCYGTLLMGTVLAAFALAPLLLLLWGFGLLTSGSIGGGFIVLLISAGLGYVWYRAVGVPRWKVNARVRDHRIRYLS